VLSLPGETNIPWGIFDADWYCRTYPETNAVASDGDPRAVREYYLGVGQKRAHSLNRMFGEEWHRRFCPRIAECVAAGNYTNRP
jgi:hypothetical protein